MQYIQLEDPAQDIKVVVRTALFKDETKLFGSNQQIKGFYVSRP